MRFLTDEDVCPCLAVFLRFRGHEAQAICEKGLSELVGQADEAVLEYAVAHGMALVTFSVEHYEEMGRDFEHTGREHRGLVLAPQRGHRDFEHVFRWMDQLLTGLHGTDLCGQVRYLGPSLDALAPRPPRF